MVKTDKEKFDAAWKDLNEENERLARERFDMLLASVTKDAEHRLKALRLGVKDKSLVIQLVQLYYSLGVRHGLSNEPGKTAVENTQRHMEKLEKTMKKAMKGDDDEA